jgi:hypothetical protein
LIKRLEDCDPEAEVLMAHQPSWPLQFMVRGVFDPTEFAVEAWCEDHDRYVYACGDECRETADAPKRIYIVEGSHPSDTPYAPRNAWEGAAR